MQWIIENWVILLLGVGMLAMHLFGHGHGHGRKHGARTEDEAPHPDPAEDTEEPSQVAADRSREDGNG